MATEFPYDIYREKLGRAYPHLGYALWNPDPGRYPQVQVGDVGYVSEGKFHHLVNTLLSEDDASHPSLRYGLPEHHEQFLVSLPDHIDHDRFSPNDLWSHGVTRTSGGLSAIIPMPGATVSGKVSFSCEKKQGATLSLPVESLYKDTRVKGQFRTWIIKHIESWFDLTEKYKLEIKMEDIVLVTGFHRTSSWSNTTFQDEVEAKKQFSLGVDVTAGVAGPFGALGIDVKWESSDINVSGVLHNAGPSGKNLLENQCIFVRGFRAKRIIKKFIYRTKGPRNPNRIHVRRTDDVPEMEVISIPSVSKYRDPLHVILDYIAKQAPHDCDMALVHDDDLKRILEAGDCTSLETLQLDMVDLLERLKPEVVLEVVSIPHSLPVDNTIPRTDTKSINVAMLSTLATNQAAAPVTRHGIAPEPPRETHPQESVVTVAPQHRDGQLVPKGPGLVPMQGGTRICRMPGCNIPVYFDRRFNEFWEWCSTQHIHDALGRGMEKVCKHCAVWPRKRGYGYCGGNVCNKRGVPL